VNNHGLPYLRRTFEGLGYRVRDDLTRAMRRPARRPRAKGGGLTYFAKNPIAFERVHPLHCATPMPLARGRSHEKLSSRKEVPSTADFP